MRIIKKIIVENTDAVNLNHMDEAFNLIGGQALAEDERKVFARIRGNDFTFNDVDLALSIINRRAEELIKNADTSPVFSDPLKQKTWADGIKANARLAMRQVGYFMHDFETDMRDARAA